jgi:hypothetical protein
MTELAIRHAGARGDAARRPVAGADVRRGTRAAAATVHAHAAALTGQRDER